MASILALRTGRASWLAWPPSSISTSPGKRIPDILLILAGLLLLLLRALQHSLQVNQFLGAAAGFLFFLGFWALTRQRLGFGDVKLSALVGFLVGPPGWVVAVFLASLGGILTLGVRRLAVSGCRDSAGQSPSDRSWWRGH